MYSSLNNSAYFDQCARTKINIASVGRDFNEAVYVEGTLSIANTDIFGRR